MPPNLHSSIVYQPTVSQKIKQGIDTLVSAIQPTLGPLSRYVAVSSTLGNNRLPELLDDGGLIARRIFQLAERDEDVGAMYLRQMLWTLHETVGDGTATAAVLFKTIFDEGLRYIQAGANAMRLRSCLNHLAQQLDAELASMARPVREMAQLYQLAETMCSDAALAKELAEIFYVLGEYGQVDIRLGNDLRHEFVEGMYWQATALFPKEFHLNTTTSCNNALVLISDLDIEDPQELAPLIAQAIHGGFPALLLIANKLSDRVLGLLTAANQKPNFKAIATTPPSANEQIRSLELQDIALLTGGEIISKTVGSQLKAVRLNQLGQAHRVWVTKHLAGIVGGKADASNLRNYLEELKRAYHATDDLPKRQFLRQRISKMMGGSATLWLDDAQQAEVSLRQTLATRTAENLRGGISGGFLIGGGLALRQLRAMVQRQAALACSFEERCAAQIMVKTLEMPLRVMLENGGYNAGQMLHRIAQQPNVDYGLDFRSGQIGSMLEAGIIDSATVQRAALSHSIRSAALALTIDTIVHRSGYAHDTADGSV